MGSKPSYLGLLNAIAVGEAEAEQYLHAWCAVSPHPEVQAILTTVAAREGEHAKAFAKRIDELGYTVRHRTDPDAERRMAIASSTELSDREKLEQLRLAGPGIPSDGDDVFAGMFRDRTIDIQTGALLGRYIAEERDTGRLFAACHAALVAAESPAGAPTATVEERLDRIERLLEKLVLADPGAGAGR